MVKSLDDFSFLPSAPGVLYWTFFLFQENTDNVNTTPQSALFTWCKYNIGRIPQHQACWSLELHEDKPQVPKPLRQAQCFVWVLHYQPLSLIRYAAKLGCWEILQWQWAAVCCSSHNLNLLRCDRFLHFWVREF
jgi:hypothetical protein